MALLDALIIAAFIIYAVSSGFRSRKKASENLEEYFLAGRSLKGWQAGLSMAATQFAADTPLLVTGLIATAGVFAIWQLWIVALSFLLLGFVLAPCWRRAMVLTDAELTELRYGSRPASVLRGIKAIYFGTIFNCTVLAWVFFAATKIAEPFLLWHEWLPKWMFDPILSMVTTVGVPMTLATDLNDPSVWILSTSNFISIITIVLMTLLYSTTGGLRAVVATDIFQVILMFIATAVFMIVVVDAIGGFSVMTDKLYELYSGGGPGGIMPSEILAFTPTQAHNATWAVIAVFALQWIIQLNADGTGYLAQRSMACRSDKDAKQAAVVFTFVQILLRSLLWLPIGVGLLILFPFDQSTPIELMRAEREATFVRGMAELLPVGLKGLMITGMLAALASTVDTHLNWGSSYWTNDIYKRFICRSWLKIEPSPRSLVWVARGANVLILIIALGIGTQLGSIQEAWQISLLLGAGVGPLLILRWIWWRMNAWAEIGAIAASIVLSPIAFFNFESQALRLLFVAAGCTLFALIIIYAVGPEKAERLREFYQRVHPPGFWKPFAVQENRDPEQDSRRFFRGLLATLIAAFSVFCLLVGIGSWMIGSPAPIWFPSDGLWIAICVILGLGLIPVWRRIGMAD